MKNTPLSLNAHDSSFRAIMQALEQLIQQLQSSHTLSQETIQRVLEAQDAMHHTLRKIIEELESTKRSAQDRKELRSLDALLRALVEQWSSVNKDVIDAVRAVLEERRRALEDQIKKELDEIKCCGRLFAISPCMRGPLRPPQKHGLLYILDRATFVLAKGNLVILPLKPLNAALYTLILSYAPDPVRLGKETLPESWNLFKDLYAYFSQRSAHYVKFVLRVESKKSYPACWSDLSNKIYKLVSEINAAIRRTEELPEKIKEKLYIQKTGAYRAKRYYIQLPPEQHRLPVELREILQRYQVNAETLI